MIYAHHVIDALRGKGRYPLACDASRETKLGVASLIANAEKFDFGTLILELDKTDDGRGRYIIPTMTEVEIEAWTLGLLPLPAPLCWYEFTLAAEGNPDVDRSMLLLDSRDGEIRVIRIDLAKRERFRDATLFWPGTVTGMPLFAHPSAAQASYAVEGVRDSKLRLMMKNEDLSCYLVGSAPLRLALYLTMMLNSQTTESKEAPPPSRVKNSMRVQRALYPLPAHRIVTIVPERFLKDEQRSESEKREHRPPRLHWRRSHFRHFDHQTANSKYLSELEHNGMKGWWVTMVARMLVGRADLGEVSHEYRVKR